MQISRVFAIIILLYVILLICACSSEDRASASDAVCAGSTPVRRTISSWLNVWQCRKSLKYRAFLLPEFQKSCWKNEGWHCGVLRLFRELNPHKGSFGAFQRSIYRLISDFSAKNSTQSFGLGFSGFHEIWKHWNRVLFCFLGNQVIENLSAICEPLWRYRWQVGILHHRMQLKPLWTIFEPPVADT